MSKVYILRLDLGNGTKIKDVQVWDLNADKQQKEQTFDCKILGSVDMKRLPLWVELPNEYVCYSASSTTTSYFRSKLLQKQYPDRGLVAEVLGESATSEYMIFYSEIIDVARPQIKTSKIDISIKRKLDNQLLQEETPRAQSAILSKDQSIDAIVAKKLLRRTQSTSRISKHVQMTDYKRKFVSTLSNCILSGLRLRGIPERQADFQQLYKMTYSTAEFAFRDELKEAKSPIYFEQVQEAVELILKLFTKS